LSHYSGILLFLDLVAQGGKSEARWGLIIIKMKAFAVLLSATAYAVKIQAGAPAKYAQIEF